MDDIRINGQYYLEGNCFWRDNDKGPAILSNFCCRITEQNVFHDGPRTLTQLTIEGELSGEPPVKLKPVTVTATEFASLGWISDRWGMAPVVYPVNNGVADVKTAIQLFSTPKEEHIYTHTGWTTIGDKPAYLSTTGAITAKGHSPRVRVQLPTELQNYALPAPEPNKAAAADSLRLINLGPKTIMWPLLLATYRAAIAPTDFAIHLAGRTGTYKSELCALMQSHYGPKMDARHLPAAWSSTGNALEALAYKAKDAIFVVDDFVPTGTSWQVRALQSKADSFIRGAGNQAGRSRLTDILSVGETYYPRGIVLSTGEDIPEGHSIRGRMFIMELTPGDIEPSKLTAAQARRPSYSIALADWIHWLASTNSQELQLAIATDIRDRNLGVGHARTPSVIGELTATLHLMGEWLRQRNYFSDDIIADVTKKGEAAVLAQAGEQQQYLQSADPCTAMCETIRHILLTGLAHLKTKNGGVPAGPTQYGWNEQTAHGEMPTYKALGPKLGWVDQDADELLIDPSTINVLKKHSGGRLAVTTQTLMKRLKDANLLTRVDAARERNTVRMTLDGHAHNVLCLCLSEVMDVDRAEAL